MLEMLRCFFSSIPPYFFQQLRRYQRFVTEELICVNMNQCLFRVWLVLSWIVTTKFKNVWRIKTFSLFSNFFLKLGAFCVNTFGMQAILTNRKALCCWSWHVRICDVTSFTWCYTWRHAISLEHCTRRRKLPSLLISYRSELTTRRSTAFY